MPTYIEATREVLVDVLSDNDNAVVFGHDTYSSGGVFRSTAGLREVFGPKRIRSFPPGESLLVGAAIGAATAGLRPIIDLSSTHELAGAIQHLNQAGAIQSLTGGDLKVPLTIRLTTGFGFATGPDQAGDLHPLWCRKSHTHVVAPADVLTGCQLLKAAIHADQPTIILEDRSLYDMHQEIPEELGDLELGHVRKLSSGDDAVIVAWGAAVPTASAAAKVVQEKGKRVTLFDLSALWPLDIETIGEAVQRCGRLLVLEPTLAPCSIGAELTSQVQELCFEYLDAPIARMNVRDSVGYSPTLESSSIPTDDDVSKTILSWLDQ